MRSSKRFLSVLLAFLMVMSSVSAGLVAFAQENAETTAYEGLDENYRTLALALYKDPEKWERLVKRIMNIDFSWNVSAKNYVEMYKNLC